MIKHNGQDIPTFTQRWDPFDKDWIWVAWDDVLDGATISSSTWVMPDGWASHDTRQGQTVEDVHGTQYTAANAVLTSNPDADAGEYTFANRVVLSDGREYERSATVKVAQQ